MLGSYRLFLQMAHVSVQMAQDHMATAFHFLISKRLPPLAPCWCVEGGGMGVLTLPTQDLMATAFHFLVLKRLQPLAPWG
jgi:hypothetical protein